MDSFALDQRLLSDSLPLGRITGGHGTAIVRLMNNSAVPWLLLIPETTEIEFIRLQPDFQRQLLDNISLLGETVLALPDVEKLNIAAIGNVVSQLHWHVVGRHAGDYCWPDVVWGKDAPATYGENGEVLYRELLQRVFGDWFQAC